MMEQAPMDEALFMWIVGGLSAAYLFGLGACFKMLINRPTQEEIEERIEELDKRISVSLEALDRHVTLSITSIDQRHNENREQLREIRNDIRALGQSLQAHIRATAVK